MYDTRSGSSALKIAEYNWSHIQFNKAAIDARKHMGEIQVNDRIWYAGTWRGYGLHQDAIGSGLEVARGLGCDFPDLPEWRQPVW